MSRRNGATFVIAVVVVILAAFPSELPAQGQVIRLEQWFTILGGWSAYAHQVAVDKQGRIHLAGAAVAGLAEFPITPNALQPVPASQLYHHGFLVVLDPTAATVLYGTYLAGLIPKRLRVDSQGYIYVLSDHTEPDLDGRRISFPAPITPGVAQSFPGYDSTPVLLKFAPSGELVYGTFVGGLASVAGGLDVDSQGRAVVCGTTVDPNLPVSGSAFQPFARGRDEIFLVRVSADGRRFEALTYLGGRGSDFCEDVRVDGEGNIVAYGDTASRYFPVTAGAYRTEATGPQNLFVTKLNSDMSQVIWSTYAGGSGFSRSRYLAEEASGDLILTGETNSFDFSTPDTAPTPPSGSSRPFVAALDPTGSNLRFAYQFPMQGTFVGAAAEKGTLHAVIGGASVGDLVRNATLNAVDIDGLLEGNLFQCPSLLRFDPAAHAPTYFGPLRSIGGAHNQVGIAVTGDATLLLVGRALETYDRPGTPVRFLGHGDTVIFRADLSGERLPLLTQALNAASLLPGAVSPGQLIELRGVGFQPDRQVQVLFDGVAAPVWSVKERSLLATVPRTLAPNSKVAVQMEQAGGSSTAHSLPTVSVAPALFTRHGVGAGQAMAANEDGRENGPERPVAKGANLRLYATGLGIDGLVELTIRVSGVKASVTSVAPPAGYPDGYMAIDIVVPIGIPDGDFHPVEITLAGKTSQPGVTIAVRSQKTRTAERWRTHRDKNEADEGRLDRRVVPH